MRELSGRALVSDTFSKGGGIDALDRNVKDLYNGTDLSNSTAIAGLGLDAHRAGYHILYGDGRVAWWGDPQESLIWHLQGWNNTCYTGTSFATLKSNYTITDDHFGSSSSVSLNYDDFPISPLAIWHEFDVSGGVDTTVQ